MLEHALKRLQETRHWKYLQGFRDFLGCRRIKGLDYLIFVGHSKSFTTGVLGPPGQFGHPLFSESKVIFEYAHECFGTFASIFALSSAGFL